MKEIAYTRIITITKNHLTIKGILVIFKFLFYIRELGVELILFALIASLRFLFPAIVHDRY